MRKRQNQLGYLMEVPLIAMATAVLLAVLLPKLDGIPGKIVAILGAMVFLWVFHYMIMRPGWQPGAKPLRFPWNALLYGLVAMAIFGITGLYLFGAG